ncbi:MAG: benzoyl-CoA 2,3-epoxidase subunit BoxA [Pseudomonadota bacterium]
MHQPIKQHLIDPEICIRCHTCEEACQIGAITHNDDNVVVDASKCNFCMDCIAPCPTGSIDNWRVVTEAYSVDEQLEWMELPEQEEIAAPDEGAEPDSDIARLLAEAHEGAGGQVRAPASAATPSVQLFTRDAPAMARVQGNYRLTAEGTDNDVRHIILDMGATAFPVLEGQSIGITPPDETVPRLYSISSPRDGERPGTNNLSLTVKREPGGKASNYLCDLEKGAEVAVTGPFGSTFLMPEDRAAKLLMICTGTGSAPFRAFTMRHQRSQKNNPGKLMLFFGARSTDQLPYFGPLQKIPAEVMQSHLVFSRETGAAKEYVQDRMRAEAGPIAALLSEEVTHIFICGLKAMEAGVDAAFDQIAVEHGLDWAALKDRMRDGGRYHVETY